MNTPTTTKPLTVLSIIDFVKSKGFKTVAPSVRVNTNGYPFITFINHENVAENVYFSKAAANAVTAGTPVTREMLKTYQIGITNNEAGEERHKIITNSDRLELSDLLD